MYEGFVYIKCDHQDVLLVWKKISDVCLETGFVPPVLFQLTQTSFEALFDDQRKNSPLSFAKCMYQQKFILNFDFQCSESMRQQMLIYSVRDICCKKTERMYFHNMAAAYLVFHKFPFLLRSHHQLCLICVSFEFHKFLLLLRSDHPICSKYDFLSNFTNEKIDKLEMTILHLKSPPHLQKG